MKHFFIIFVIIFVSPAISMTLVTENQPNACLVSHKKMYAKFIPTQHSCSQGYFLPANSSVCSVCPVDAICNGGIFAFNPNVAQGIIYHAAMNNMNNVCSRSFIKKWIAKYEATQHSCSQGYFLPANSSVCSVCPVDAICNGGIFAFNPNVAQGIIYHAAMNNMNNVCSRSFIKKWIAKYEPNTINLNYDDGNGNVTQITCDYGDTIVIPENVPTRTGYNFTGWTVRPASTPTTTE